MKKLILVFLFCFITACASKQTSLQNDSGNAGIVFKKLEKISEENSGRPYRFQLSLRFGQEGDTRRVTGMMWGEKRNIRLDLMAGVGASVAMISDFGDQFLLYSPQENRAYSHKGNNKPVLRIGSPLPFNLPELADILTGNYAAVFGNIANYTGTENGCYSFALADGIKGEMVLNSDGLPLFWQKNDWKMTIAYEKNETLPQSLRLINANGKLAVLMIKEREFPKKPFTDEQMTLSLPSGTPVLPLANYKQLKPEGQK